MNMEQENTKKDESINIEQYKKEQFYVLKKKALNEAIKNSLFEVLSKLNKCENKLFKITLCKNSAGQLIPVLVGKGNRNFIAKTPLKNGLPDIFLNVEDNFPKDRFFEFPKELTSKILNYFGNIKNNDWKIIDVKLEPLSTDEKGNKKYRVNGVVLLKKASYLLSGEPLIIDFVRKGDEESVKILSRASFLIKKAQFEQFIDVPKDVVDYSAFEGSSLVYKLPKTVETRLSYQFGHPPLYRYSPLTPEFTPPTFVELDEYLRSIFPPAFENAFGVEIYVPRKEQSWGHYIYEVSTYKLLPEAIFKVTEFDSPRISKKLSEVYGGVAEDYKDISKAIAMLGFFVPVAFKGIGFSEKFRNLFFAMFPNTISYTFGEIYDVLRKDPSLATDDLIKASEVLLDVIKGGENIGNLLPVELGTIVKIGVLNGYISLRERDSEKLKEQIADFILPLSATKFLLKDIYKIPNVGPEQYLEAYSVFKDLFPYQTGEEAAKNIFVFAYYQQLGGFGNAILRKIGDKIMPGDVSRKKLNEQLNNLFDRARNSAIGNAYGALLRMKADGLIPKNSGAWRLAEGLLEGRLSVTYPTEVLNIIIDSGVDPDVATLYFINNRENAKAVPLQALPAIMESTMSDWRIRAEVLVNNALSTKRLPPKARDMAARQILDMMAHELGFENFRNVEMLFSSHTINAVKELNLEAEKYSKYMIKNMPNTKLFYGLTGAIQVLMEPLEKDETWMKKVIEAIVRTLGFVIPDKPQVGAIQQLRSLPPSSNLGTFISTLSLSKPGIVRGIND